MKKFLIAFLLISFSIKSFAQTYDIYLKFNDGTNAKYSNVSGKMDVDMFKAQVANDFPGKTAIVDAQIVPSGAIQTQQPVVQPVSYTNQSSTQSQGSSAGQIIGTLIAIVALGAIVRHTSGASAAFPCVLPTDRARDGSLCGGRASTVRPGGR